MSSDADNSRLLDALKQRDRTVMAYLADPRFRAWFQHPDLRDGVFAYVERPAKRLRPSVLLMCAGAVGGDESDALPAAAAVELFHTWTLVHDDLIDHDDRRRGGPAVHAMFRGAPQVAQPPPAESVGTRVGTADGGCSTSTDSYGRDVAILVGDSQQGWSVWLLLEVAARKPSLAPVVIQLAQHLESHVINRLIEGQILDVQFTRRPLAVLTRDEILNMLMLKTGALYEFCALAGAAIGLNETNWKHPWIAALADFARRCGTAFQLQDDVLGVVGDAATLGKPVGSDIREGKRTLVTRIAFERATAAQRERLNAVLGNRAASESDVEETRRLLLELGGVEETSALARRMTEEARPALSDLPASEYRTLLLDWAEYLIRRTY